MARTLRSLLSVGLTLAIVSLTGSPRTVTPIKALWWAACSGPAPARSSVTRWATPAASDGAAGPLSGAAIGHGQDEIEAKNRALIAQQLGRQVNAGAVTPKDVIDMTKAGVNEDLILNHIRVHGMAAALQPQDLIYLQQQGISPRVIATMQACPPQAPQPQAVVVEQPAPPPVVVGVSPYWGPHYYPRRYYW